VTENVDVDICVAYETLARRGELVALEVRDIDFHPDGTDQVLIRRGKTDAEGQGRVAYLSRETVRWLKLWLEHAEISDGVVFRRLVGQTQVGGPLNPGSIAPIFKRVAQWIGMPVWMSLDSVFLSANRVQIGFKNQIIVCHRRYSAIRRNRRIRFRTRLSDKAA
jgi:integrase